MLEFGPNSNMVTSLGHLCLANVGPLAYNPSGNMYNEKYKKKHAKMV